MSERPSAVQAYSRRAWPRPWIRSLVTSPTGFIAEQVRSGYYVHLSADGRTGPGPTHDFLA